eukprot:gene19078-25678_t
MEIPVHRKICGAIIGPQGQSVASIRKQARVQLHVHRDVKDEMQIVELRGNSEQTKTALALVRKLVQETEPTAVIEAPKTVFIHLDVVPEMVAPILGSKGSTAKSILTKTKAQIKIGDINPESRLQRVSIIGDVEAVKLAYVTVRTIISRFNPSRVKTLPPANRRGPGGPAFDPFLAGPPPPFFPMGPPGPEFMGSGPMVRGPPYGRMGGRPEGPGGPPRGGGYMDRPPPRDGPLLGPHGYGNHGANEPLLPAYRGPAGEAPPPILMLQPDGTYKPAPAGSQGPPMGQAQHQAPGNAGPAGASTASTAAALLSQLSSSGLAQLPGLGPALMSLLQQQASGQAGAGATSSVASQIAALMAAAGAATANPATGTSSHGCCWGSSANPATAADPGTHASPYGQQPAAQQAAQPYPQYGQQPAPAQAQQYGQYPGYNTSPSPYQQPAATAPATGYGSAATATPAYPNTAAYGSTTSTTPGYGSTAATTAQGAYGTGQQYGTGAATNGMYASYGGAQAGQMAAQGSTGGTAGQQAKPGGSNAAQGAQGQPTYGR